jgi:2-oxoisovalerate dehydrogenase E2 component (dihydrolipoyl transacylase)
MDATKLIALRKELKKIHNDLTMLPFFIKALSLAMEEYPLMNSVVNPDVDSDGYIKEYVIKHDHNFAVAIDSPDGLTTPLIKNCN